jgi:hypothetical protein
MADDVLVNKAAAIERAVRRVREEHAGDDKNPLTNQTKQDAIILNLQRACESSIDAAMHMVRVHRLGVPQQTREAFDLLQAAHMLDDGLTIFRRRSPARPVIRSVYRSPEGVALEAEFREGMAVARDGSFVVYKSGGTFRIRTRLGRFHRMER